MPSSTPPSPNLQTRLLQAMNATGWIAKDASNTGLNFDFARVEVIKDKVREALHDAGVMVHTSTVGSELQVLVNPEGRRTIMAKAWGTMAFVNADDPSDVSVNEWHGMALDTSDKALAKAVTSGVKQALLNALLIPTGQDPDQVAPEVPTAAPERTERPSGGHQAPVTHSDAHRAPQGDPGPVPPDQPVRQSSHGDSKASRRREGDKCPKHNRGWKLGNYGYYCSAKDDTTERGYCNLLPTEAWEADHER